MKSLVLDIGGSSVKSGLFDKKTYTLQDPLDVRLDPISITGHKFSDVKEAVIYAVKVGLQTEAITSVGISTTGSVWPNGVVKSAGHFEGYENIDWSKLIRSEFSAIKTVATENDGKASAWAEYKHFGGVDESHVHFVLGTGVGSSTIVRGELMHGDSGEAGFLGHTVVTSEPTILCSCERTGCIETIASAPGLAAELSKIKSSDVEDFAQFTRLLSEGDPEAFQVLERACKGLGLISAILANSFNPKNITFGGGVVLGLQDALRVTSTPDFFLDVINQEVNRVAFSRTAASTNLHYGVFDNDGGMVGAGLLA
ncbi:MAG: ROK family protein [Paracoccaceae bacterium]|nr:ROK family protein [Paracoccaceae bacterium]